MENKKTTAVIIVVILLIGAGFWYMFSKTSSSNLEDGQASNSDNNASAQTTSSKGTLSTLLSRAGNYTCTLDTIAEDGSKTSGTIYASGGKTRFYFKTQDANGLVTISHVIRDGAASYSWYDGQTTGIKKAITPTSPVAVAQPKGMVIMINGEAQIESECIPWIPKMSAFTPPQGITF